MRYFLPRISRKTRAEKKMSTSRLRYDYAGKAVPAGSVVAEPRGTDDYPGSRAEVELTTRDSTELVESSDDGYHHPCCHQDHPDVDYGTEYGFLLVTAALSRIPVSMTNETEPIRQSSRRCHHLTTDASQHDRRSSAYSSSA